MMNLREIDRLVATKVLQLEEGECPITDRPVWLLNGGYFADQEDFRPSEDIFIAWQVIEKFEYHKIEKDAGFYYCTVRNTDEFFEGVAETAELAICLAALKAVGVEVEVNEQ
jgi:hypothetical protein